MPGKTTIAWTERTWNPSTGCDRTSPGCDNCYALVQAARNKAMGSPDYQTDGLPPSSGPGFGYAEHPDRVAKPLAWAKPAVVFVNSMSDMFHHDADSLFVAEVFAAMSLTPRHTYQVLTKRSKAMAGTLSDPDGEFRYKMSLARRRLANTHLGGELPPPPPWPLPNVWLGVSVEDDRYAFRAGHLRAAPAAVRFVSAEPLLGPLPSLDLDGVDWLIVGGESGPGARPMDLGWARELRDRCAESGTAFFFKQLGVHAARALGVRGKGEDPDTHPDDLRVRQWPAGWDAPADGMMGR